MGNSKTDRRIIRTKKFIRDALTELMEEKGFEGVTVRDLTKKRILIEELFIYTTKTNTICLKKAKMKSFKR